MVVEYTNFGIAALEMRRSGIRLFRSLTAKNSISFLMFWMSHGNPWSTLQILAKQVFSMVASSAASERNFSAFTFVHTKQRNSLAKQVFSMVASSAAYEQNFSAFAFVHTKQRNSLIEVASVKKLVYVRTNNLHFKKQQGVAAAIQQRQ